MLSGLSFYEAPSGVIRSHGVVDYPQDPDGVTFNELFVRAILRAIITDAELLIEETDGRLFYAHPVSELIYHNMIKNLSTFSRLFEARYGGIIQ